MDLARPVDLVERIRFGANALVGCLRPDGDRLPYWNCGFAGGNVTQFADPGVWDSIHNVPRALHALSMAEGATGDRVDPEIMTRLGDHLIVLFDGGDDLPAAAGPETGKLYNNAHNFRETTHGLTALIKRGNSRAADLARRMIRRLRDAIGENGRLQPDRFPHYFEIEGPQPEREGRTVDALVRYYRVTGDEAALDLAYRLASYALKHCFMPEGALRETAGAHGHSINALLAGMADLGLLTNDAELMRRAKGIYDVGVPRFNSTFGWSMESLDRFTLRGESNNSGDLLRAALVLGKAGWPQYFEAAERILRSHILPSQVLDVDAFSDNPHAPEDRLRSLVSRIRGGFSFPTPNDYLVAPDAPIVTYDITSGAVDGMCEALHAAVTEGDAGIRINLLLDREVGSTSVKSALPGEGKLTIQTDDTRNALVRLPSWVSSDDVRLTAGGRPATVTVVNGYVMMSRSEAMTVLEFPVRKYRTKEWITYKEFTIDWRGDQIVAMLPPAANLPMFPPCEQDRPG